jgi:steroid delta-isomerase-like uncharacterized protein
VSTEANKALVRRHYEEVWNAGDLALIDQLFAPDFMVHSEHWGPEGERQWVTTARTAFPDIHFTIEAQVAEDDLVVTRWSWQGTHRGAFMDLPATGRAVSFSGITIYLITKGKLVQDWTEFNWLDLQRQLDGSVPAEA